MGVSWTQSTPAAKFAKKSIAVQAVCRQDVNEIVGTSWTLSSKQDQIFYTMKKRTKYICKFQIPIWTCWGPQVKKLFWGFFLGMGQFVCVQTFRFTWYPHQVFCYQMTHFDKYAKKILSPQYLKSCSPVKSGILKFGPKLSKN